MSERAHLEERVERKIEGRGAIEVIVEKGRGMITVKQEDTGAQDPSYIELTPFDVPVLVKMLREAAKELKTGTAED